MPWDSQSACVCHYELHEVFTTTAYSPFRRISVLHVLKESQLRYEPVTAMLVLHRVTQLTASEPNLHVRLTGGRIDRASERAFVCVCVCVCVRMRGRESVWERWMDEAIRSFGWCLGGCAGVIGGRWGLCKQTGWLCHRHEKWLTANRSVPERGRKESNRRWRNEKRWNSEEGILYWGMDQRETNKPTNKQAKKPKNN